MLAIKLNKNWWIAGAFCALAIGINVAEGSSGKTQDEEDPAERKAWEKTIRESRISHS